jgi:hypothetical protein
MSTPTIQVLVGFEQTTGFATPFQLDSATYGLLDTGTLGGIQMVDVTEMVQSISITRGRNRNTEAFNAGTAQVTFHDPTRQLDPLNASSPYYPYVEPRQPIEIYANGCSIYQGTITDWNLDYYYTDDGNIITAACSDAFTILAQMTMNAWTPVEQMSGARIEAVLSRPDVAYQGGRNLDTGQSTLGGTPGGGGAWDVAEGTNVLQYLQRVEVSEAGFLFMDRTNDLTFVQRFRLLNPAVMIEFTDDGTGIPYSSLLNQFGDELLYNYVHLQSPAGAVQDASDADSIARYQSLDYSKLDLLNSTTSEVLNLANRFLAVHKDPFLRFTGVSVQLAGMDAVDQETLLDADLTDVATVQKSFGIGSPSSVTETLLISGIAHEIRPGDHRIKFTFESIDTRAFFELDSPTLGVLDTNLLAF